MPHGKKAKIVSFSAGKKTLTTPIPLMVALEVVLVSIIGAELMLAEAKHKCLRWPKVMGTLLGHRNSVELAHAQSIIVVKLMIGSAGVNQKTLK